MVDAYAQSKLAEIDRINLSKKLSADTRRKISKQYNDYVKGCFKGNVQELIESCNKYNATLKENDTKRKDMTVFDGLVSANEADDIANDSDDSTNATTVSADDITDTAVSSDATVHTANDSDSIDTASATVDIVFKEGVFGIEDTPTVATTATVATNVDDTSMEDYIFQRQIQEEIFDLNAIVMRNSSWM